VNMRLRIAIDALKRASPAFWELDANELLALLNYNAGIGAQFEANDELTVGFVIRTVRIQHQESVS
ncbi:hypothetical protein OFL77_27310, partial [Escherichia coli]|uniref:hypothetical protein n=1 Tax=Escherichia coli TaxID=562 RepID=UPI0021DF857D